MQSVDSVAEAIQLAEEVRMVHAQGGFHIRNWISNSPTVIEALEPKSNECETKDFSITGEPEKILGMRWDTATDTFCFALKYIRVDPDILNGKRDPTKREVLSTLSSIFDPLGFLAFYLVFVKILMQRVWRTGIDWDDPLSAELCEDWERWTRLLPKICELAIPRCYYSPISLDCEVQLHIFVDASESAYATVAFWRFSNTHGTRLALIGAKTKVVPLQAISIPRAELQAAILGARFGKAIIKGHTIGPDSIYYWSDSETVLKWLRSDQRNYKPYVALRVGEIVTTTNVEQWRFIPTKLNVADDATKWTGNPEISSTIRWFVGPEFLLLDESEWPIDKTKGKPEPEEELRTHLPHIEKQSPVSIIPDMSRVEYWRVLVRTQAYVFKFVNMLKRSWEKWKQNGRPLKGKRFLKRPVPLPDPPTSEELTKAENSIFRHVQTEAFGDEMCLLRSNSNSKLPKSSPIWRLTPYIDESGVLRHRGRIDAATDVAHDVKRPIILPRRHIATEKIINHYHRQLKHANHETVINELRQRFVVAGLRSALREIRAKCQECKIAAAKPAPPQMGDLPPARLSHSTKAFEFVGMDYFGPLNVKVGRSTVKRYGVLFTCLTVRAVHIEVANSLDTDA